MNKSYIMILWDNSYSINEQDLTIHHIKIKSSKIIIAQIKILITIKELILLWIIKIL